MKFTVVHPGDLGAAEVAKWREIQLANPALANPFLAPEFTVAVGRVRPESRVAVLTEGPDTVGFFPFERRGMGFGAPICAGHNDCQGLVHVAGLEWDVRELLRACGLAVWEFDHLVAGQVPFLPYQSSHLLSPIMDLSAGFEPFVAQLRQGSNRLKNISRKQRRLAREVGELRFDFDVVDRDLLRTVMQWKSAQYLRTGWADRFARPWIVELLDQLVATRSAEFAGVLSVLYAGDRPVAGHFGIRSASVLAHWFPSYDTGYSDYSPGLALHLSLAEGAAGAGIGHIDMGPGPEGYKQWFRSRDLVIGQGAVVRGPTGAAAHWVRRAPANRLQSAVESHPSVHRAAKRARASYLRVDSVLRRRRAAGADGSVLAASAQQVTPRTASGQR
ncbi:GNAT family N-acetyltransferase [Mycobacterium sp. C3-094]